MRLALALVILVGLTACDDDASEDAGMDAGAMARDGGGPDAGATDGGGADAAVDAGASDAGRPPGLVDVPPPEPVVFGDTIETLTVELRTAAVPTSAGTNDGLEVCLSASRCFPLDTPAVDDFRVGELDVFQIEGVGMPRADVDRVELRTRSTSTNNDRFTPGCLALRFDGEPVYCNDAIPGHIGTGPSAGEAPSFTDPLGLHEACVTCGAGTLSHAPVVGPPPADGVRVWVRTDATRPVALQLSESPDGAGLARVAWVQPRPTEDYTAVLVASGLPRGTTYHYRVEVDGEPKGPWRPIQTAPPDDASVRFGFGSCSQEPAQPIFDALRREQLDAFLFVGDTHYLNRYHRAAHRFEYRRIREIGPRAAFLSETPVFATWDDHDFVGNNSDGGCVGREQALEGFREYWPNPPSGAPVPGAISRQRLGIVDFFVLDCRYHRPRVDDPGRRCDEGPALVDDGGGPIGMPQMTWLLDGLAASTAPFKVVACGSLFTSGGVDSWASFPAARDTLMTELAARSVSGVVLASGDIHRSEIRDYARAGAYDLVELVSSPLAQYARAANPGRSSCSRSDASFCYHWDSFITVEATAAADPTLTARVHDEAGAVVHERVLRRSELE